MGCSEAVGLAMDGPAPSLLCSHRTLSFGLKSRCVMPGHSIGVESSGKVSSLDVLTITAFPAGWSELGAVSLRHLVGKPKVRRGLLYHWQQR